MSRENSRVPYPKTQSPHVGLSAQLLSLAPSYRSAGINRYTYNLLQHLARHRGPYRFTAFLSDRNFPATARLNAQWSRLPTARPPIRIFWEQIVQPWVLWRQGIDLLHAMAFVSPLWCPCPSVVTIYDLSFLRYPESFRRWNRFYLSTFVRLSARRANHFIAISKSTAQDIVRLLGVKADQVSVVHCGVEESYHPMALQEIDHFRRQRGLPEKMLLYLGTIEPRKNLGRLIEAYHLLMKTWAGPEGEGDVPRLVIAGAKGWLWEEVFALVESLGLQEQVIFPGYVPGPELPAWYNAAEVFVYPSTYEGFGLPVLEAMACGTPVVTSNTSSLPEVVGEAGLTVAPEDVEGLCHAMKRALTDAGLRKSLHEQGLQRAALFSWDKAAQETVAIYDRVLGCGG